MPVRSWTKQLRRAVGPRARDILVSACQASRLSDPSRFAREKLTIVTFHRVLPAEHLSSYPMPGIAVTPPQLEQFLGYFTEAFDCLPLHTAFEKYLTRSRGGKPILSITFDDGAYDNFKWAFPILESFNVRASFYIPVDSVRSKRPPWPDRAAFALASLLSNEEGIERLKQLARRFGSVHPKGERPNLDLNPTGLWSVLPIIEKLKLLPPDASQHLVDALQEAVSAQPIPSWAGMMTESQLRELSQAGHEIGSHSLSHPMLPLCDDTRLVEETRQSRRLLSEMVDRPIASFCYPDGAWDSRCVAAVRDAGYACAVTTDWGLNSRDVSAFELRRCDMNYAYCTDRLGGFSAARLAFRMSGLRRIWA